MQDAQKEHDEIIIIRRSRDDHDDHHGGVWKIAFADFMTAMMAFFLVMWLINASNEETKKAVASYFNPVKLMDTTTNPRGVKNPKYGQESDPDVETDENSTSVNTNKTQGGESASADSKFDEQALFSDPYALLSEIAGGLTTDRKSPEISVDGEGSGGDGKGLSGGSQFQDPFDPSAWNMQFGQADIESSVELGEKAVQTVEQPKNNIVDEDGQERGGKPVPGQGGEAASELGRELAMETAGPTPQANEGQPGLAQTARDGAELTEGGLGEETNVGQGEAANEAEQKAAEEIAEAEQLAEDLRETLSEQMSQAGFNLEVEMRADGTGALITLSDQSNAAMFNIGSARPTPELVRVMEKIGQALAEQNGSITIAGHTDARPYRGDDYDNWRLSTARAHMAYYMLVRGGYPEDQVDRIEGHAERQPKLPDDTLSPANRRIEIFLRAS